MQSGFTNLNRILIATIGAIFLFFVAMALNAVVQVPGQNRNTELSEGVTLPLAPTVTEPTPILPALAAEEDVFSGGYVVIGNKETLFTKDDYIMIEAE